VKTTRRRRAGQAHHPSSQQRPQPSASKTVLDLRIYETLPVELRLACLCLPTPSQVLTQVFVDADEIFRPGIYRFPGSRSRRGLRKRWGQIQYAMQAILAIYHGLPPEHFNASKLRRDVRDHLANDPDYCGIGFREISRQTVLRAVEHLRADNRPRE
jgi:hypothetical protein